MHNLLKHCFLIITLVLGQQEKKVHCLLLLLAPQEVCANTHNSEKYTFCDVTKTSQTQLPG